MLVWERTYIYCYYSVAIMKRMALAVFTLQLLIVLLLCICWCNLLSSSDLEMSASIGPLVLLLATFYFSGFTMHSYSVYKYADRNPKRTKGRLAMIVPFSIIPFAFIVYRVLIR